MSVEGSGISPKSDVPNSGVEGSDPNVISQVATAAVRAGVPGIPLRQPLKIAVSPMLPQMLTIKLRQPGGAPASNVAIATRNAQGEVLGNFRAGPTGEVTLQAGAEAPSSFEVIGSGMRVPISQSDLANGVMIADVPAVPRQVTFFGQVAKPTGDPAEGVGLSIQRSDNVTVALTVSDPNGAWFLSTRENHPGAFTYQLYTTGTSAPVDLPDLGAEPDGLYGPINIVLSKLPAVLAKVAPASALLSVDNATADQALRLAPQLFSRGRSAVATSACSPYTPIDAASEIYNLSSLGMFPPPSGTQTITAAISPVSAVNF